ncbi:hypothetical protein HRE53_17335 [Acaryochloris sp. 'Moss Beach']|uniref:hypothetical protein n=1 Tax=Acaryochloris sp. 'Moss Beach' TaxID=2740837 RepID=UPI001F45E9DC|nr:hypothetical protein [Acaryochloris sp. 'Moss Beach']UJB68310.1 hypothetical protein HRE53_17335 [Acaryochloris sp. 'Moss Beach']
MAESLRQAYQHFGGIQQSEVPWIIWLLENPDSPLALAGAIPLKEHDYLHLLLNRGKSPEDEAFIIGFTMGNDSSLHPIHLGIFKFVSRFLYPQDYRFTQHHCQIFDTGVKQGKQLQTKNLCRFDFSSVETSSLEELRAILTIDQTL